MILYKKLNFIPVPENLLNFELTLFNTVKDSGYGFSYKKNNIELTPCIVRKYKFNHEPLREWVKRNIVLIKDKIKYVCIHEPIDNKPSTQIVHSDILRKTVLIYLIDTGGDNVITTWYQERGKSLYRGKDSGKKLCDSGFVDYDNLDVIESVKLESKCWYVLDGEILHDVDNIISQRKSLHISLNDKIFLE
jgi:hypothetical protein